MALDIRQGDVLVYDGKDYPIKICNAWAGNQTSSGIQRMCSLIAATKRSPAMSNNQRGEPVTYLSSINISPISPPSYASQQSIYLQGTHAPANLYECYVDGGDTLYHLILEVVI